MTETSTWQHVAKDIIRTMRAGSWLCRLRLHRWLPAPSREWKWCLRCQQVATANDRGTGKR